MYLSRALEDRIGLLSRQFPVILLTGPRQVGKTTLLRRLCAGKRRYVTLDDLSARELASQDAALFLSRFAPPVLIDEIQYAPALLGQIKMAVDETRRPGDFWLTGSQQFHVMKGVTETLAGRVAVLHLLGLSARERHRKPCDLPPFLPTHGQLHKRLRSAVEYTHGSLFRDIWMGSLPGLVAGPSRDWEVFYRSYLQTYLERDVRDLLQVGSKSAFARFVTACASRTAQLLNLSDLARDADVSVPTAKNWLSILETSFQVVLVQAYHTNVTKRLVKAPKLYFIDTGLCAYLTGWTSPQTLAAGAMAGAVFETHVLAEILKSWWGRAQGPQLYYFRDKDRREVDFVFVRDGVLLPVEAKLGATPKREWIRAFSALRGLGLEVGEGAVVCLCKDTIPIADRVNAIPVGWV